MLSGAVAQAEQQPLYKLNLSYLPRKTTPYDVITPVEKRASF